MYAVGLLAMVFRPVTAGPLKMASSAPFASNLMGSLPT
jgi:hypothetical protein